MPTRYYKTKTEPTKGFSSFHQPRVWIPGRKAPRWWLSSPVQRLLFLTLLEMLYSKKEKAAEIPASSETAFLSWTLMCLDLQPTQTSRADVTQQCPASRKMPMAGGGARAGGRGKAFGLITGAPRPPLCPVLKSESLEHWHHRAHPPQKIPNPCNRQWGAPQSEWGRNIHKRTLKSYENPCKISNPETNSCWSTIKAELSCSFPLPSQGKSTPGGGEESEAGFPVTHHSESHLPGHTSVQSHCCLHQFVSVSIWNLRTHVVLKQQQTPRSMCTIKLYEQ